MWCLAKFLPLMIGGVVSNDDEHWQHYLQLLEIIDIVFSPAVSTDDLGVLEGIIDEYLHNFTQIYPGKSVIPKMHYLVHYPSHIYRYLQLDQIVLNLIGFIDWFLPFVVILNPRLLCSTG